MSENPSQATASSPSDPNFSAQPWHRIDGDPSVDVFAVDSQNTRVPKICSNPAPFPDQYLSCCQPKGHVGSHEYPPRLASAVDRFWRCPRCSRTGRFPVMEEESTERLVALVQHARSVHADGDSCSCQFFTFSDTPQTEEKPSPTQILPFVAGVNRMCARCTVYFSPASSSAKFCEICEIAATRGGVSRLPKDVVAAAAHLPAELSQSPEEKDATLRVYTDRIAALQKRCDLQARMHKEQVIVIQSLEQRLAELREVFKDAPEQGCAGCHDEEVIYPERGLRFWIAWIITIFFLLAASAFMWRVTH